MSLNRETLQTKLLEAIPEDFRLLERAYWNIYQPAFPQADHRERLADLKNYVQTNQPQANQEYDVLVATHTSTTGHERPVGVATANRLTDAGITIAFFEYAAIHPSYRGQGLWGTITRARTRFVEQQAEELNTKLFAVFAETEKAALTQEEKTLPLEKVAELLKRRIVRRELFRRIRFSDDPDDKYYRLEFNYIQLPLRDNAYSICDLDLLARFDPEDREKYLTFGIPGEKLLQCLQMFFNSFEVRYNYREHPDFTQMEKELKDNIPLQSIT